MVPNMTLWRWLDIMEPAIRQARARGMIRDEGALSTELAGLVLGREGDSARWFLIDRAIAIFKAWEPVINK